MISIAKDFAWEMGHRLPNHPGQCKNPHGHSYKMRLILNGTTNQNGMIIDYNEVNKIVENVIEKYNHAFVVNKNDNTMWDFLEENEFKYIVIPFDSTAENLTELFAAELISAFNKFNNIHEIKIRIQETKDVYAEKIINLKSLN